MAEIVASAAGSAAATTAVTPIVAETAAIGAAGTVTVETGASIGFRASAETLSVPKDAVAMSGFIENTVAPTITGIPDSDIQAFNQLMGFGNPEDDVLVASNIQTPEQTLSQPTPGEQSSPEIKQTVTDIPEPPVMEVREKTNDVADELKKLRYDNTDLRNRINKIENQNSELQKIIDKQNTTIETLITQQGKLTEAVGQLVQEEVKDLKEERKEMTPEEKNKKRLEALLGILALLGIGAVTLAGSAASKT